MPWDVRRLKLRQWFQIQDDVSELRREMKQANRPRGATAARTRRR